MDQYSQNKKVGQLIRNYRKDVNFKQKKLAQKAGVDPSMLSRFENGRISPTFENLQKIISILQLSGIAQEKIDLLWKTAGFHQSDILNVPVSSKVIPIISQELQELKDENPPAMARLEQELQDVMNVNRAHQAVKRHMSSRRWGAAEQELVAIRKKLEQRVQKTYLSVDEDLGACLFSLGRYDESIHTYESAYWYACQTNNKRKQAGILIRLGSILRRQGGDAWQVARQRYETALTIFQEINDPEMEADCLRKIGSTFLFQGIPDEALPYIEKSLEKCKELDYQTGIYKGLQHKGWAYNLQGRWREASLLREEALDIIRQITDDEWEIVKGLLYVGDSYRLARLRDEARNAYDEALQILQKYDEQESGRRLIEGTIWLGLAKIYNALPGQELEAKTLLNKSIELYKDLKEDFQLAEILNKQGDLLTKLGQFSEAEQRLTQAKNRFKSLKNEYHFATSLVSLGELYFRRRQYGEIQQLAVEVKSLQRPDLLDYQLAKLEFLAGKALAAEKQFQEAFAAIRRAYSHALQFNDEVFLETTKSALELSSDLPLNIVNRFLDQLINYIHLVSENASGEKRNMLQECQKVIIDKQQEMDLLSPIA